jgi:hypothetical protein
MEQQTDREMSRVEAAAYLTDKGRSTKVATLAKYVSSGEGPPFTKNNRNVVYKQSDLDAWLEKGPPTTGRPAARKKERAYTNKNELLDALAEFMPMVDRLVAGKGTFADGLRFAQVFSQLKRFVYKRINGSGR